MATETEMVAHACQATVPSSSFCDFPRATLNGLKGHDILNEPTFGRIHVAGWKTPSFNAGWTCTFVFVLFHHNGLEVLWCRCFGLNYTDVVQVCKASKAAGIFKSGTQHHMYHLVQLTFSDRGVRLRKTYYTSPLRYYLLNEGWATKEFRNDQLVIIQRIMLRPEREYADPDKRSGLEPNSEPNCKLLQKTVEEWHLEAILFCNIFDWVWPKGPNCIWGVNNFKPYYMWFSMHSFAWFCVDKMPTPSMHACLSLLHGLTQV